MPYQLKQPGLSISFNEIVTVVHQM